MAKYSWDGIICPDGYEYIAGVKDTYDKWNNFSARDWVGKLFEVKLSLATSKQHELNFALKLSRIHDEDIQQSSWYYPAQHEVIIAVGI